MSAKTRTRHLQIITPEEELENLRNEVGVLQRAVESKSAAVGILRTELQECQRERDKFRLMAEQGALHRTSTSITSKPAYSDPCRSAMLSDSEGTLAQLLSQSKDENKMLRLEGTDFKCRLHDAQADIKVLREEVHRLRGGEGRRRSIAHATVSQLAHQEREQFISQMEALSARCQALEGDVRGLVEEREELIRELDASMHKTHRLNHILNTVLAAVSGPNSAATPKRIIDLDAIITENRYLQQRMKQTEEERNMARGNASKYKAALEKCRSQGTLKLGTSENLIVTPKQVYELLHDYKGEMGGAAESDLKSLCVALVDALNQRSRALRTQRSANKMLVSRVTELERQLMPGDITEEGTEDGEGNEGSKRSNGSHFGSLGLMEGYVHPSGPMPKCSQDEILQDPRLLKLLGGGSKKEVEKGVKTNDTDKKLEDTETSVANKNETVNESTNDRCSDCSPSKAESVISPSVPEKVTTNCDQMPSGVNSKASHPKENSNRSDEGSDKEPTTTSEEVQERAEFEVQKKENKHLQKAKKTAVQASSNSIPSGKVTTFVNPNDDLEEIIPIDQLDSYIKEVQLQRKHTKKPPASELPEEKAKAEEREKPSDADETEKLEDSFSLPAQVIEEEDEGDDDDSSFDLDISDYDSDNDNLDAALEEWQRDCAPRGSQGKNKKSKSSPNKEGKSSKREKFSLFKRQNSSELELPPALQKILDQATADAIGGGMECT